MVRTPRLRLLFLLLLVLIVPSACAGPANFISSAAALPWPLTLPSGYKISIYAKDLGELRSIAFDASGVPFVTVMNRTTPKGGKVFALPDTNGDGMADKQVLVADQLDRPHGIVFHDGHMYVSEMSAIWRLEDTNGDFVADSKQAVVADLPTAGDHWARPFVFTEDGSILVAIGSTCNNCQEGDKRRATVVRFTPADQAQPDVRGEVIARGLRSVVGLVLRPGTQELWGTNNGRDYLKTDQVPDTLVQIENGKHYGWPYCYGDRVTDMEVVNNQKVATPDRSPKETFCAEKASSPALLFGAHSAPLELDFYNATQFPEEVRGSLFVALHGSWDFANTNGYRIVRIPFVDGKPGMPEDFVTGWVPAGATEWLGRPVAVKAGPNGSLFITDDVNGYVYRVDYTGA